MNNFVPKKWCFFGHVYPEVPQVWLDLPLHHGESSLGFSFEMQASVRQSRVSALVTQNTPIDLPTLKNAVASDLSVSLDLVGLVIGAGLEIVLDTATSDFQETHYFDAYIPVLKNETNVPLTSELLDAVGGDPAAQLMLSDFKMAMRLPEQTAFHCYRAVEAAMQSFRQDNRDKAVAWKALQEALNVDELATRFLESFAASARHGQPTTLTDRNRAELLTRTKEIALRYVQYVVTGRMPLDPDRFPRIR